MNLHATDRKLLKPLLDPQLLLIGVMKYRAFTSMKQAYENHGSILQPQKRKLY